MIRPAEVDRHLTTHVDAEAGWIGNAPDGSWKILRLRLHALRLAGFDVQRRLERLGHRLPRPDAFDAVLAGRGRNRSWTRPGRTSAARSIFLHTDSWELGPVNWTPALPEEFARLRGYEMTPYLPVLAGYVVEDRDDLEPISE